jgi:hypothetical protein
MKDEEFNGNNASEPEVDGVKSAERGENARDETREGKKTGKRMGKGHCCTPKSRTTRDAERKKRKKKRSSVWGCLHATQLDRRDEEESPLTAGDIGEYK